MAEAYDGPGLRAGMAPFVSRSVEIDLLDSVLERLGEGGPAVVDVTGEAGIGKSRLLAEFCARARRRGLTVLRGWAAEYEQHSPFRPFADAFADLDARVLRALPMLAELPPVLRGDIEGPGGPGAGDRFGLYQATAAVLGRLGGAGLVVILDDLHWADPASLELLGHLVRHPVPAPLALVVSRRDRQAPATLSTALADGMDTGAVLRLALGPLGERDCVEELAGDLPQPQAADLYAASEGNPLYFLALLQAHRGAQLPRTPFSTPPAPASYGGPDGLPAGLEALLLAELSPLSPLERLTVEAGRPRHSRHDRHPHRLRRHRHHPGAEPGDAARPRPAGPGRTTAGAAPPADPDPGPREHQPLAARGAPSAGGSGTGPGRRVRRRAGTPPPPWWPAAAQRDADTMLPSVRGRAARPNPSTMVALASSEGGHAINFFPVAGYQRLTASSLAFRRRSWRSPIRAGLQNSYMLHRVRRPPARCPEWSLRTGGVQAGQKTRRWSHTPMRFVSGVARQNPAEIRYFYATSIRKHSS